VMISSDRSRRAKIIANS